MKHFSRFEALKFSAALQILPEFHASNLKIWALSCQLATECRGNLRPNEVMILKCLQKIDPAGHLQSMQDSPEDTFIGRVLAPHSETMQIFQGRFPLADKIIEDLLLALLNVPEQPPLINQILKSLIALCKLSSAIALRMGFDFSNSIASEQKELARIDWQRFCEPCKAVVFSEVELLELGIEPQDLEKFVSPSGEYSGDSLSPSQTHDICKYPILKMGGSWLYAMPGSIFQTVTFNLEALSAEGLEEALDETLAYVQWKRIIHEAIRPLGLSRLSSLEIPIPAGSGIFASEIALFEKSHGFHVIFAPTPISLLRNPSLLTSVKLMENKSEFFDFHDKVEATLREFYDVSKVSLVIIGGNLGIGFKYPISSQQKCYFPLFILNHDLLFVAESGHGIYELMASHEHIEDLKAAGVHIMNFGGLVLSHAARLALDGVLLPDEGAPQMLFLEGDFLFEWRKRIRTEGDRRVVCHPLTGEVLIVTRYQPDKILPPLKGSPAYIQSYHELVIGPFRRAVISDGKGDIWLEYGTTGIHSDNLVIAADIWDCVLIWLRKLWLVWPRGNCPKEPIVVVINFLFQVPIQRNLSLAEFESVVVESSRSRQAVRITVPAGYLKMFSEFVDNSAERKMIYRIAEAMAILQDLDVGWKRAFDAVFANQDEKHFHLKRIYHAGSMLQNQSARFKFWPDKCDTALIHWRLLIQDATDWAPGCFQGKERCVQTLQTVKEKIWTNLETRVGSFNGRKLTIHALHALNNAMMDREHHRFAAKAILAARTPRAESREWLRQRRVEAETSAVCIRALIEMIAYSNGPQTIAEIGNNEFAELVGEMHLLVSIAQQLILAQTGWVEPDFTLHHNGKITWKNILISVVTEPFEDLRHENITSSDVDFYDGMMGDHETELADNFRAERDVNEPFEGALIAEFGFGLDVIGDVIAALENKAVDENNLVLELTGDQLSKILTDVCGFTPHLLPKLIKAFALPRRTGRFADLGIFRKRDVEPWFFRRGLSILGLPWINVEELPSQKFIIGVGLLRPAIVHRVSQWASGEVPSEWVSSNEMKVYAGGRKTRLAEEFERKVSELYVLAGYKTLLGRKLPLFGAPAVPDLGDVDVIAWKEHGTEIILVECKKLLKAILPSEIVSNLEEFKGTINREGKPDSLLKHLNRVAWLRENSSGLLRATVGQPNSAVSILSRLVFALPNALQHHSTPELRASETVVTDFDSLRKQLGLS